MQTNTAKFTGKPLEGVSDVQAPSIMKKPGLLKRILSAYAVFGITGALCVMLAQPVSADLNLSFIGTLAVSLFDALTTVITPLETFIDAGFPLLIKIIIYVAIIGVIYLGIRFGRQIMDNIAGMIGFK